MIYLEDPDCSLPVLYQQEAWRGSNSAVLWCRKRAFFLTTTLRLLVIMFNAGLKQEASILTRLCCALMSPNEWKWGEKAFGKCKKRNVFYLKEYVKKYLQSHGDRTNMHTLLILMMIVCGWYVQIFTLGSKVWNLKYYAGHI